MINQEAITDADLQFRSMETCPTGPIKALIEPTYKTNIGNLLGD
jgi:hypothetical protein